jgi:hypothetical protein
MSLKSKSDWHEQQSERGSDAWKVLAQEESPRQKKEQRQKGYPNCACGGMNGMSIIPRDVCYIPPQEDARAQARGDAKGEHLVEQILRCADEY